jgi:hypothetical protein
MLVKLPVLGVVAPIDMLLIDPAVAGLITTVPVPVGLIVTLALAGLRVAVLVTASVVNVAGAGDMLPMVMLSKVPAMLGFSTKVPVTEKFGTVKFEVLRLMFKVFELVLVVTTIAPCPFIFKVLLVGVSAMVFCPVDAM